MSFAGKNVLVTGGSSGMGKATAKLLSAAGANLFIVARDPTRLKLAADEIRSQAAQPATQTIQAIQADVSQWDQVRAVVKGLEEAQRIPDYLFNFAGYCHPGYFHELPISVFREMMDVLYFGTVHTVKAIAPFMMQRRSGYIINTSSVAGMVGVFGYSAYGAAKYAIRGFTDTIRSELKPYDVRVSILFPPDTDTPGFRKENEIKPMETVAISAGSKVLTADEVGRTLLRGVERGQYAIIPGVEGKLIFALSGLMSFLARAKFDADIGKAQQANGARPCTDPSACLNDTGV